MEGILAYGIKNYGYCYSFTLRILILKMNTKHNIEKITGFWKIFPLITSLQSTNRTDTEPHTIMANYRLSNQLNIFPEIQII